MMLKKMMTGLLVSAMMFTPAVAQMVKDGPYPNTVYHQKMDNYYDVYGMIRTKEYHPRCVLVQEYDRIDHSFGMHLMVDIQNNNIFMAMRHSGFKFNANIKESNIGLSFFKDGREVKNYNGPIKIESEGVFAIDNLPPEFLDYFGTSDNMEIDFKDYNFTLSHGLSGSANAIGALGECYDHINKMENTIGKR